MAHKVSFKTKRGRRVSFTAGTGRRSQKVKAWQRVFGKAARKCEGAGKVGSNKRGVCMANALKRAR